MFVFASYSLSPVVAAIRRTWASWHLLGCLLLKHGCPCRLSSSWLGVGMSAGSWRDGSMACMVRCYHVQSMGLELINRCCHAQDMGAPDVSRRKQTWREGWSWWTFSLLVGRFLTCWFGEVQLHGEGKKRAGAIYPWQEPQPRLGKGN